MKNVYANLTLATGARRSGLCLVMLLPKEWLLQDPIVDFISGKVLQPLQLMAGKSFLTIQLTHDSYLYDEKPKSNKSGSYYEVSVTGTINHIAPEEQQVLETLRYSQFVALVKTRDGRLKLVGNKSFGLVMQSGITHRNSSGGNEVGTLDLQMEVEQLPPFYQP